jgi:WD40 repeat protein
MKEMKSILVRSLCLILFAQGLCAMDDAAFNDATSDDEYSNGISLNKLPSLTQHRADINFITCDSGAVLGVKVSEDDVVVTDLNSNQRRALFAKANAPIEAIDGRCFAQVVSDKKVNSSHITISDLTNGKKLAKVSIGFLNPNLALSSQIVVVADGEDIEAYSIREKQVVKRPGHCPGYCTPLIAVSADGTMVAEGGVAELWVHSLADDSAIVFFQANPVHVTEFSPDNKLIAAVGDSTKMYRIDTRKLLWEKESAGTRKKCAAFNADSTLLAVGHEKHQNFTSIFDVRRGTHLYELWAGADQVLFSPDGKQVITRGADGVCICELAVLKAIYDTFTRAQRANLNRGVRLGKRSPELELLRHIDEAMQGRPLAFDDGHESEMMETFEKLPAPLKKAFRKYIAINPRLIEGQSMQEAKD